VQSGCKGTNGNMDLRVAGSLELESDGEKEGEGRGKGEMVKHLSGLEGRGRGCQASLLYWQGLRLRADT
jgi:hypothetical protein